MNNHLIIGLGGTGGKIIRALRKTIYQEFRNLNPDTANVRFLYVDSSKEMMDLDDPTWRTLGRSVQLDRRSQLLITGSNLNTYLDKLENYPQIQPWIGSRDQWRDILNSIVGETLGGQKRRLGRFLYACKASDFNMQLQQLAGEIQTGGLTAITFHICCGLAGGTGSGSLIDIISQIRKLYRDSRTYRIILYTLLPDEFPKPNWDTGNYHANGYAGLLELNSLSVDAFQPHDVAGRGERLKLPDPFNGCYVFTNQNANGLQVDVEYDIPTIVADFLFQKIFAVADTNWANLARMENAENGDGTPESRPGTNIGERSKRFLTFGIKRLTIPEEEIREYLTYKFARQAALQLRFNNWSDSLGFLDESRPHDFGEVVRQKDTQERWLLTDEHLCLSHGILAEEINNKRWRPINREWMDTIPQFVSLVQQKEKVTWLNELDKLCRQRFDENYRGLGVRKFYETKLAARQEHVREIRRRIEADLFDDWKNGVKSMHDLSRLVDALGDALDERLKTVDGQIVKARENEEQAAAKVNANRTEEAKVGPLADLFGKRRNLLKAQGQCLQELYIYRTQIEARNFAKRLLQDLITEINQLGTDIRDCVTLIDDTIKEFNDRIAQRCNDEKMDLRQSVVRFYQPAKVKDFVRELEKNENEQKRQAQGVRLALIEQLGDSPGFAAFHNRITKQRFFNVLEQKCEASAEAAHDNLVAVNRDRSPLFGVNIVGMLEREYSGNEEGLRTFVHNLVSSAGNYLDFDANEVNRVAPGIQTGVPTRVSQFTVIMPKAQEYTGFSDSLQQLFRQQLAGTIPVEIIESATKPNEITLISVTNLFPLRYIKPLRFLRERYERRLNETDRPERVKLELHCEGDGAQHPDLLVNISIDKYLPHILLAKILQLIRPIESQVTGETELYLIEPDEYGIEKNTKLGKNLGELSDTLNITVAQKFEELVNKVLDQPEYRHKEKRTVLASQVREELNQILATHHNNIEDRIYKQFADAARKAIQQLQAV